MPIHRVVEALGRAVTDVPMGQPSFADDRYHVFDLSPDKFSPLPKQINKGRLAFVDGGSAELLSAPNFAIGLNRVYFGICQGDQRHEPVRIPSKIDFFTVCHTTVTSNHITYKTDLVPVKEEWANFLPDRVDLEFNPFDQTLMTGFQRVAINRARDRFWGCG